MKLPSALASGSRERAPRDWQLKLGESFSDVYASFGCDPAAAGKRDASGAKALNPPEPIQEPSG